ncbi:WGR domain-containing protein [Nonomuraea sp. NPDC050643]|uniref:WGR domain-containing protein n=1 Tax=Nonomuraea sp. NPDC050643 TaxID=3155660 RepID=UPI0033D7B07F
MSESRTFEKRAHDVVRLWQIEREGIRCHMSWGVAGGVLRGSSTTLDDEAHAERHFHQKIREKRRQGYTEVVDTALEPGPEPAPAPAPDPDPDPFRDVKLLDLPRAGAGLDGYEPFGERAGVYVRAGLSGRRADMGFWHYLVLTGDERRALVFNVRGRSHDPGLAGAFLDFLQPRRELAFDGASHHKVPLDTPIGPFTHALFCSPMLSRNVHGGRVAWVFPIHDCEIGDADTETFAEARIEGRGALPNSAWDRDPCPVTDLRFDLRSADGPFPNRGDRTTMRQAKFRTGKLEDLTWLLPLLATSSPESHLQVRSYRGEILTLRCADLTADTLAGVRRFVHGDQGART